MKTICAFLFFITISFFVYPQDYELITKIDTVAKIAKIDNLGNLYIVTPKNEILKYSDKGAFLWNYTNKSFGDVEQLDVTDPLRVVLYYAQQQQIVVLNNNLNEISKFSFNQNIDVQITLIASANNNGFWVYDQLNRELKKLSNSFVDESKTGNIYQRDGFDMQAIDMVCTDDYIFINDTKSGIRIFDRFGNFYKTAAIKTKYPFEVEGTKIYFSNPEGLFTYDFLTFETKKNTFFEEKKRQFFVKRLNRLVILNEKELTLWSLKK